MASGNAKIGGGTIDVAGRTAMTGTGDLLLESSGQSGDVTGTARLIAQ